MDAGGYRSGLHGVHGDGDGGPVEHLRPYGSATGTDNSPDGESYGNRLRNSNADFPAYSNFSPHSHAYHSAFSITYGDPSSHTNSSADSYAHSGPVADTH